VRRTAAGAWVGIHVFAGRGLAKLSVTVLYFTAALGVPVASPLPAGGNC
jgi:hypothetical protein